MEYLRWSSDRGRVTTKYRNHPSRLFLGVLEYGRSDRRAPHEVFELARWFKSYGSSTSIPNLIDDSHMERSFLFFLVSYSLQHGKSVPYNINRFEWIPIPITSTNHIRSPKMESYPQIESIACIILICVPRNVMIGSTEFPTDQFTNNIVPAGLWILLRLFSRWQHR